MTSFLPEYKLSTGKWEGENCDRPVVAMFAPFFDSYEAVASVAVCLRVVVSLEHFTTAAVVN